MSLLSDAMESCTRLVPTDGPDGYGGSESVYTDGSQFDAAITFNTSVETTRAQSEGAKALYTVTTSRSVILKYHEAFRRNRDGKVFRCTSAGGDKFTPKVATLDMMQVTAEEWSIPNE